jgi:hypothetical protein
MALGRALRASVIVALAIVSVWKCETWKNPPAAVRDAAHFHVSVPHDFFQEWASGRNYLAGVPVYNPQKEVYVREFANLGFDPPPRDATPPDMNPVNAHPPASILVFLPLARVTYVTAFRIWSVVSIVMIAAAVILLRRELGPGPVHGFWIIVTLMLLFSFPLREQMYNGQLNPVLLLCITGAWIASRRDRDGLAGVLLGIAAAVKLFPLFLFIAPALRRRWSTLAAGAVTIIAANIVAVIVLGVGAYRDYVFNVMPALVVMQSSAYNASLVAFWKKLFDSPGVGFLPVHEWAHWPAVALIGLVLSAIAIIAAIAVSHRRARDREGVDLAFAAVILGMVLLSPITWPHGFLILLLPLVLLARRLDGQHVAASLAFVCCLFLLTARPTWWLFRFQTTDYSFLHWVPPGGLWLITAEALQSYALVGVFVLVVFSAISGSRSGTGHSPTLPDSTRNGVTYQRNSRCAAATRRTASCGTPVLRRQVLAQSSLRSEVLARRECAISATKPATSSHRVAETATFRRGFVA